MTTSPTNKIDSLASLLKEKERLKQLCRTSENLIEKDLNYIRYNYIDISVDQIIVPAIKRTFSMDNILHFFNLEALGKLFSGKDGTVDKDALMSSLAGVFGKTGWFIAAKLGYGLVMKFFKRD